MVEPAFISYARATASGAAQAIADRLSQSGAPPFLDTSQLRFAEQFPRTLMEALFASSVVVVLLDEVYLRRWYCLRELSVALAPYTRMASRKALTDAERDDLLSHVVVALSPDATDESLTHMPPFLRTT